MFEIRNISAAYALDIMSRGPSTTSAFASAGRLSQGRITNYSTRRFRFSTREWMRLTRKLWSLAISPLKNCRSTVLAGTHRIACVRSFREFELNTIERLRKLDALVPDVAWWQGLVSNVAPGSLGDVDLVGLHFALVVAVEREDEPRS